MPNKTPTIAPNPALGARTSRFVGSAIPTDAYQTQVLLSQSTLGAITKLVSTIYVDLLIESPVVPGQPITFHWTATTGSLSAIDVGKVTTSLYLVDSAGDIDPSNPVFSAALDAGVRITPQAFSVNPQPYTSKVYAFTPPPDQAKEIYRIGGGQLLRLVVTGSGPDAGPYTSDDTPLVVQAEDVTADWWAWTVPSPREVDWKKDHYLIQGNFTNESKFSEMSSTLTLLEFSDGPTKEYPSSQFAVPVASGQTIPVPFNYDFSKSWSWFIPGIWSPNGEPSVKGKNFSYLVELDLVDQFDNVYPRIDSSQITVHVRVSDLKFGAQVTAFGLMAGAIACAVAAAATACIPGVGSAFGSAAAGLAAGAAASGGIALDPPFPDPAYKTPVKARIKTLPSVLSEERFTRPIASLCNLALAVVARVTALGIIDSRILGARRAGNRAAEKAQRTAFRAIARQLVKDAAETRRLGAIAGRVINTHPRFNPTVAQNIISKWRNNKAMQEEIRELLKRSGGSEQNIRSMEALLHVPAVTEFTVH